jgi:capsular exopolysaccharide synthesis family protein
VLELFNHTLQTVDQAESVLGLPLLAAIPEWKARRRSSPLLVRTEDTSQREAFRTLRTALDTRLPGRPENRSFLFTSAVPGEGKSFCSLNFAATLAKQGCHTLFVAADLRRGPDLSALLKGTGQPGLSEYLGSQQSLSQSVHETRVPNLFLCPAGQRPPEPAGLLAGGRFAEMLREALLVFDRVVVDTPPINAVSDCLVMAPHVDALCLVTRVRSTPVNAILRACRLLARAGVTPTGFVMNRVSMKLGGFGAYYYYGAEYAQAERELHRSVRPA